MFFKMYKVFGFRIYNGKHTKWLQTSNLLSIFINSILKACFYKLIIILTSDINSSQNYYIKAMFTYHVERKLNYLETLLFIYS